jgi:hypothetical protein
MDGGYAENAGAFFGGCIDRTTSSKRNAAGWTDTAGNAGAFSGGCLDRTTYSKRNAAGSTDTPEMQEHFPAGA